MSGASSMRNAVKRICHKERGQLASRKNLGLLEKHSDYKERANDYKKKKSFIKHLRKKAKDRNPDEFYYKMNSSQVSGDGLHRDIIDKSMDNDTIKLLKSQDMGYIVHKKSVDARKIEKLKENLHLIGAKAPKQHTVFVDSTEELETFDIAKHFDAPEELVHGAPHNRLKTSQVEALVASNIARGEVNVKAAEERNHRQMELSYRELYERSKRAKKLNGVMEKLQLQRNLTNSKGGRTRIVKRDDGTIVSAQEQKAQETERRETEDNVLALYKGKSRTAVRNKSSKRERNDETVLYKWKRQRSK
jgi:U3 small nucleolar RNA-associated protein 11